MTDETKFCLCVLAVNVVAAMTLFTSSRSANAERIAYVGDSIAVGLGEVAQRTNENVIIKAAVGRTTKQALSNLPTEAVDIAIVSTGSNDQMVLHDQVAQLRTNITAARFIWVLPYQNHRSTIISSVADRYGDASINLQSYPTHDGVHPKSYAKLHSDINRLIGVK